MQLAENNITVELSFKQRSVIYQSYHQPPTELFYHLECVFHCFPCIAQEQNHRLCKQSFFPLLLLFSFSVTPGSCNPMDCNPPGSSVHGTSQASGLPFPSPRDLPDPGIEPEFPALAGRFFTTKPRGSPFSSSFTMFIFLLSYIG